MAFEAGDFSPVRLSLANAPPCDRAALYHEVIGRQVARWDLTPLPGAELTAELTWRALPGLEIVTGGVGATVIRRTHELIADGNDGFALSIALGGRWRVEARGRELDETKGAACLTAFADPSTVTTPENSRFLVLSVPREALTGSVSNLDDVTVRPIPADCEALRLLRGYLGVLESGPALATATLRQAVATHVHDLIALTLGATRDAWALARRRGLAAARLRAAKADIIANLRRPICTETIAARQGVTARHLQRLFEAEGSTVSAFVLERRLALARAVLADPGASDRTVTSIAFECGFTDLSHFNRAFRRHYGLTPSDARAAPL